MSGKIYFQEGSTKSVCQYPEIINIIEISGDEAVLGCLLNKHIVGIITGHKKGWDGGWRKPRGAAALICRSPSIQRRELR